MTGGHPEVVGEVEGVCVTDEAVHQGGTEKPAGPGISVAHPGSISGPPAGLRWLREG